MLQKVAIPPPSSLAIFWSRAFDSVTNILCPARAIALKISSCHKTDNNNTISKIAQHRQQILLYSNQILILSSWWSLWRLIISPDLGMWRTEKMMTVDRRTQARWHSLQFLWLRLDLRDVDVDCFRWFTLTSVEFLEPIVICKRVYFVIMYDSNLLFIGESDRIDKLSFFIVENIFQFKTARMRRGMMP